MRRPNRLSLNEEVICGLPHPAQGQVIYWDEKLPGFGVRVTPTAKTYIIQYRIFGREFRESICRFESVSELGPNGIFTFEEVRRRAAVILQGRIESNNDQAFSGNVTRPNIVRKWNAKYGSTAKRRSIPDGGEQTARIDTRDTLMWRLMSLAAGLTTEELARVVESITKKVAR